MKLKSIILTCALGVPSLACAAERFPTIIDLEAMKDGLGGREAVDPCDDFYRFSCGTWIDQTPIPPDRKSVSRQATPMDNATDVTLNGILKAYAAGDYSVPSTYAHKLGDYYTSCMAESDTKAALDVIGDYVAAIETADSPQSVALLISRLHMIGVDALFSFYSAQDLNDSTRVLGNVGQGGMGLPRRDYYFPTDEKGKEILQKYEAYIAQLFTLYGVDEAKSAANAKMVRALETNLASAAYRLEDQNDPEKTNHPASRDMLKKTTAHFDWDYYFRGLEKRDLDTFNMDEPEFFANLDTVLTNLSRDDRSVYLTWLLLNHTADKIGGDFEKAKFAFWNVYMNGAKTHLPRWHECTNEVQSGLGYALAEAYVQLFDGAAIKAKTEAMIASIRQTFADDLQTLNSGDQAWIDHDTLAKAIEKIDMLQQKIGAPAKWRNYDALYITPHHFLTNALNIMQFEAQRDLDKIGKPVDKSEWGMMPWEVNAYYDRSNNEFVFPFGILQPPSLDLSATDGANFGSFGGGTIGHELTHGFDNNGAKYDGSGNLVDWWSPETLAQFNDKAQCFVKQADAYRIDEVGLNVRGKQTLEENLADQGGVKLGYVALDKILSQRAPSANVGPYNERQQYWIAYAQSWCSKATPESLRSQMTDNEHPPSEFRVNAVMMNRPEFARDFACAAGKRMTPATQCSVW